MVFERVENYQLLDKIGSGGSGDVYRAVDYEGNLVAIKFLKIKKVSRGTSKKDPEEILKTRFFREIDSMRKIQHENVVEILDYELDVSRPFIVQEYINGLSLEEYVKQNGPLAGKDFLYLFDMISDAVDAIHEAGVIHRDIKPANIILTLADAENEKIDNYIVKKNEYKTTQEYHPNQEYSYNEKSQEYAGRHLNEIQQGDLQYLSSKMQQGHPRYMPSSADLEYRSDEIISQNNANLVSRVANIDYNATTTELERQTKNTNSFIGRQKIKNLRPVLIDFSISQAETDENITRTGMIMGTPGYVAPETVDTGPTYNVDWWSLISTMIFATTGRAPFGIKPVETVMRRAELGFADLKGLPVSVATVFSTALQSDNDYRKAVKKTINSLKKISKKNDWLGYSSGVIEDSDHILQLEDNNTITHSLARDLHIEVAASDESTPSKRKNLRVGSFLYIFIFLFLGSLSLLQGITPIPFFIISIALYVVFRVFAKMSFHDFVTSYSVKIVKAIFTSIIPAILYAFFYLLALFSVLKTTNGGNFKFASLDPIISKKILMCVAFFIINFAFFVGLRSSVAKEGITYFIYESLNSRLKRGMVFLILTGVLVGLIFFINSNSILSFWPTTIEAINSILPNFLKIL